MDILLSPKDMLFWEFEHPKYSYWSYQADWDGLFGYLISTFALREQVLWQAHYSANCQSCGALPKKKKERKKEKERDPWPNTWGHEVVHTRSFGVTSSEQCRKKTPSRFSQQALCYLTQCLLNWNGHRTSLPHSKYFLHIGKCCCGGGLEEKIGIFYVWGRTQKHRKLKFSPQ